MKSTFIILCLLIFFVVCNNKNITQNLEINIRNLTEVKKELKVLTANQDSILITIGAKDTINYLWKSPNIKGEGTFDFIVNDSIKASNGYYSNGSIHLNGPLWVSITKDTLLVKLYEF